MALTDKLTAIANAIRAKTGGTATMTLAEMPSEIASIQTGITPSGSVTLTEEGSFNVTDKATAVVDMSATRANLAEAVTAKGVDTLPTSSFDTIATNIGLISGGQIDVKSASQCEIVTVGANSVSNPVSAVAYFGKTSHPKGGIILLLDEVTVNNQIVYIVLKPNSYGTWMRYRDGNNNYPDTFNETWSAYIATGSRYLVIEW